MVNNAVGWHKVPIVRTLWLVLLLVACAPGAVRRNNAGNQYYQDGAYQAAVGAYRQAQVTAPDAPEIYYNAANAFNRQSQLDATTAQTNQALRTADAQLAAWAWYNVGNAYFDAQDWSNAVMAYQEALRLHPDDLDAKHNLELAIKELEAQGDPTKKSGANGGQLGEEGRAQPGEPQLTPTGQSEEAGAQAQPSSPQGQEMSAEQARRLLRALIGNTQNLQQRLQEPLRVPFPPPEQDW